MGTRPFLPLPQQYKFMIGTVPESGDDPELTLEAQYNPKELEISSPIGWKEHESIGAQGVANKPMEFTGMGAETVKIELLFDAYENDDQYVVEKIATLKAMASVRRPNEAHKKDSKQSGSKKRPSFCVARWGTQEPFRCVIDSITVKYTMFSADGTPVRATVVLGLKSGQRSGRATGETAFERASMERMEKQRTAMLSERNQASSRRTQDRQAEEQRFDAAISAQQRASARDRELAAREQRIADERAALHRPAQDQARAKAAADARKAREDKIARDQAALDEDRKKLETPAQREEREEREEQERQRLRAQRKQDFDLE